MNKYLDQLVKLSKCDTQISAFEPKIENEKAKLSVFLQTADQITTSIDKNYAEINLETSHDNFRIVLTRKGKRLWINKKEVRKLSDFVGKLKSVLFSPDDIEIIKGKPQRKRKFINLSIIQFKNEYVKDGVPFYRTKEVKELANGNQIATELFISSDNLFATTHPAEPAPTIK